MRNGITTTRTIRVERDIDQSLRKLSEAEGVSVNLLVNRSLRKLVEWDAYAEKFGFVTLPDSLFTRLIQSLSEDQARDLGRWAGTNLVKEYVTFWFKEVNLSTIRRGLLELSAHYAKPFEYEERADDGHYTVILKHGKGPRASRYYSEMLRGIFEDLLKKEAKVEETENQVIAHFMVP